MHRMSGLTALLAAATLAGCQPATDAVAPTEPAAFAAAARTSTVVSGSGQFTYLDEWRTFTMHAQTGAGGAVKGNYQVNNRAQDRRSRGDVICVGVFGNRAWVGMEVTSSTDPALVGQFGVVEAEDNGEGGATPDRMSLITFYSRPIIENFCRGAYPGFLALSPLEGGNLQVR